MGSDSWLRRFPNTAIGIALGLGAQAILWKALLLWPLLENAYGALEVVQFFFWSMCVLALSLFGSVYACKCVLHRDVMWAEYYHPVRANFFCGPCISLCFISLALPPSIESEHFLRGAWTFAFFYQTAAGLVIYRRWLYDASTSDLAAAPYLMSVVAWFLLAALGTPAQIDEQAGMPLRAMCFGIGAFFAAFLYPFVMLGIYAGRTAAGSPPLFLMIASPAAAGIALIGITGGLSAASEALFGVVLLIFALLMVNGPSLLPRPAVLGVYWAYVFPVSALATLAVKIAVKHDSVLADTIALFLSVAATFATIMVFMRMSAHQMTVCRGKDIWSDPLVHAMDAAARENSKESEDPDGDGRRDTADSAQDRLKRMAKGADAGLGDDAEAAKAAPVVADSSQIAELERRLYALEELLAAKEEKKIAV